MKILNLAMILLLLLCSVVVADYQYAGDNYYGFDNGILNSDNTLTLTGNKILSDGSYMPLAYDVDNDTINDIIVYDDGSINVYGTYTLNMKYTFSLPHIADYGMPYIYDIDGDGIYNIIIAEIVNFASEPIYIYSYEFNGSTIIQEKNWSVSDGALAVYTGEWFPVIGCQYNECLVAVHNMDGIHGTQASASGLVAISVNATDIGTPLSIEAIYGIGGGTTAYGILCFPDFPVVQAYNNYYYFTYFEYEQSAVPLIENNHASLVIVDINATNDPVLISDTDIVNVYSGLSAFSGGCEDFNIPVSAPLVHPDIYKASAGEEIMFSYRKDADGFYGIILDNLLNTKRIIGDGLFCSEGKGTYLSNPILADIYYDTDTEDFCFGGYNTTDYVFFLLCDSFDTGFGLTCSETKFTIEDDPPFNDISNYLGDKTPIYTLPIHTTEQEGSNFASEIMTPFGVLGINLINTCQAGIYAVDPSCGFSYQALFTGTNNAYLVSDIEEELSDVISFGTTNIQYWDDGYSNTGAYIDEIRFNPCIQSSIAKYNTSLHVSVRCNDSDGDQVASRVFVYYQNAYQQLSNWTTNYTQGILATHDTFILNHTMINGKVRIECRDTENPTEVDYEEMFFSVALDGVEFGDCEETINIETPVDEEEEQASIDSGIGTKNNNALKNSAEDFAGLTHIPTTTLFLIVLGVIIFLLWRSPMTENNPQLTFGTIILVIALSLVVGVTSGLVGIGTILLIFVIGIIPVGYWIGRKLLGHGSSD